MCQRLRALISIYVLKRSFINNYLQNSLATVLSMKGDYTKADQILTGNNPLANIYLA